MTTDHGATAASTSVALDQGPGLEPPSPGGPASRGGGATRGRRQSALLRLRADISPPLRVLLAVAGFVGLLAVWALAAGVTSGGVVPTPWATVDALATLAGEGGFWTDVWASTKRIAIGYGISVVVGVVLGILIGSFRSVEALTETSIGFLRYIPANALTFCLLLWLGIDEAPKYALVAIGTVFFNTLMIADVARAVPRELVSASYTLGAGRTTVLRRVVMPHSLPGIVDVVRINLAAAWVMLVVGEVTGAPHGLAVRMVLANRFRQWDRMFALLVVFGLIGAASDLLLRWLRGAVSPWAKP